MPANRRDKSRKVPVPSSPPISAQMCLYQHWRIRTEALRRLAASEESIVPPSRDSESVAEWMRQSQGQIDQFKRLQLQIQRIESYLGRKPRTRDSEGAENSNWIVSARWVRALIENGYPDEAVAGFLRNFEEGHKSTKRGRPPGAMNCDRLALTALVRHEIEPRLWTWPKLADELFACKLHCPHTWDSSCTVALKQAVKRLRAFLRELASELGSVITVT